ncbi:SMC-Scp complex subunit ScpB [Herpetosiphon geysericola]|uniref:SMC-Scp complex subunit ScpB n=1 Tax=Herpetosiphon geysericola TaxID=70996 RepID=UPI001EEE22F0|nr:SMC-Scp complex subunit ScpB [Herpetosiphon geysericola]
MSGQSPSQTMLRRWLKLFGLVIARLVQHFAKSASHVAMNVDQEPPMLSTATDQPELAADVGVDEPLAEPTALIEQIDQSSPDPSPSPEHLHPDLLLRAEAVLFVAGDAVEYATLAKALELREQDLPLLIADLRQRFIGRGIRLQDQAGTLQLVSAPEATSALERFLGVSQPQKLSPAALEVLAIIAYRQPVTRAGLEAIRGVDSSGVVRSLLARELIYEVGRAETLGRPVLYGTTSQFLHIFGITSLAELPAFNFERQAPVDPDAAQERLF